MCSFSTFNNVFAIIALPTSALTAEYLPVKHELFSNINSGKWRTLQEIVRAGRVHNSRNIQAMGGTWVERQLAHRESSGDSPTVFSHGLNWTFFEKFYLWTSVKKVLENAWTSKLTEKRLKQLANGHHHHHHHLLPATNDVQQQRELT